MCVHVVKANELWVGILIVCIPVSLKTRTVGVEERRHKCNIEGINFLFIDI